MVDRDREPSIDRQGRPRPARRRHALEQHGTALRPAVFHRRRDDITATAPASANIAPPGFYMLFIIDANGVPSVANMVNVQGNSILPRWSRSRSRDGATFAVARHGRPRCDGFRPRRHRDEGRVLQRRDEAQQGHDRALQLHLERRTGRELHADRACHRRSRRHHHERGVHDHGRRQHSADRQHHLAGRRRGLP